MPVVEVLRQGDIEQDAARRRLAIQIASQLPADARQARLVLLLVSEIVERFLAPPTGF